MRLEEVSMWVVSLEKDSSVLRFALEEDGARYLRRGA